ncbi:hypothetical protein CI610_02578 [invertebrate metagenome]|uniref:Uncharacterized protein n=1 Tax=invertebrate metagenome TaxID=1711999 RepID=A0A2H9T5J3_9ZZZZ
MKTMISLLVNGLLAIYLGTFGGISTAYSDEWHEMSSGDQDEPPIYSYPYSTPMIAGLVIASTAVVTTGSLDSDKRLHFGGSVVLGALGEVALRQLGIFSYNRWKRVGTAAALGTVPGIIKELSDSTFDGGDLAADIAGSMVGAVLADLMQGPIEMPLWSMDFSKESVSLSVVYPF